MKNCDMKSMEKETIKKKKGKKKPAFTGRLQGMDSDGKLPKSGSNVKLKGLLANYQAKK